MCTPAAAASILGRRRVRSPPKVGEAASSWSPDCKALRLKPAAVASTLISAQAGRKYRLGGDQWTGADGNRRRKPEDFFVHGPGKRRNRRRQCRALGSAFGARGNRSGRHYGKVYRRG